MLGLCSERMLDARVITVCGSCRVLMELQFAVDLGGAYIQRNAPSIDSRRRPGMSSGWYERPHEKDKESFLSVVIPAKNEAASLAQLVEEITLVLRPLTLGGPRVLEAFEIIVVDDGSTDRTQSVLQLLSTPYPELTVLRLMAVGQSAATMAGIRAARGNWIATLDADLQNDPADLIRLWRALGDCDGALGWRVRRQDVWSKRVISYWANLLRNQALGQSIRDTGCSLRIFSREVALRLPAFNGMHRFFGSLLLREGCRLVQVPVHHRPRAHGRSHYSFWNRLSLVVIDLFGVIWLMHRSIHCRVLPIIDSGETIRHAESRLMSTSSR
jgi:dolichol-phosphate mannosyltransferase